MFQPFAGAPHPGEIPPGPQPGEGCQAHRRKVGVLPGGIGFPVEMQGRGRHIGGQCLGALLRPEGPQGAGTGVPARGLGLAVVGALPGKGHRGQGDVQLQDGLAVLHRQVVVGAVQQLLQPLPGTDPADGCLTRGGKIAGAGGQLLFQGVPVGGGGQGPGGGHQAAGVGVLCPKYQTVTAGGGQQGHPGPGKALGPRHGPGGRQGKHQAGPRCQGGLGPHRLGQKGRRAPLGHAAAHGHRHMTGSHLPRGLQLPAVAAVKGIVFCYDACKIHGSSWMLYTSFCLFGVFLLKRHWLYYIM